MRIWPPGEHRMYMTAALLKNVGHVPMLVRIVVKLAYTVERISTFR